MIVSFYFSLFLFIFFASGQILSTIIFPANGTAVKFFNVFSRVSTEPSFRSYILVKLVSDERQALYLAQTLKSIGKHDLAALVQTYGLGLTDLEIKKIDVDNLKKFEP